MARVCPFVPHMKLKEAFALAVHGKVDHRDQVGRFVFATVSEKQGTNLKIHYDGWSRKWDTWSDFNVELHRYAAAGSISKRQRHRFRDLKKGDYVDVNPSQRHPGWKCGEIRKVDSKSGQVQVGYESQGKTYLYWAHIDNAAEIAEFRSKSGTVHLTRAKQLVLTMRRKRFPRDSQETIINAYCIGGPLEVQDTQTQQWVAAKVIDCENNWIVVHFEGHPAKHDQKIHVVKHRMRLRHGHQHADGALTKELSVVVTELASLNWQLELMQPFQCTDSLYRCFAVAVFGDASKYTEVRDACRKRRKSSQNEDFISDFADIVTLEQLYKISVMVFDFDHHKKKLFLSFQKEQKTSRPKRMLLVRLCRTCYQIIKAEDEGEDTKWACKMCGLKNAKERVKCQACFTAVS